jgi:hypothetical protein
MKFLTVTAVVTAALLLALAPVVSAVYGEAYPSDGTQRAALNACAAADPGFNRLNAGARARCYARLLQAPAAPAPLLPRREEIAESGFAPKV